MASITHALRRIKDDLANLLSASFIEGICRELEHQWRDRQLGPVMIIHLFVQQVLHRNAACAHVPRIAGGAFSASAYCQARARLPLKVISTLLARIGMALQDATTGSATWHGHRVVLVDGSSFSMPDTPALQKHFGQHGAQKKGCGFPAAHWMAAFDAGSGLILEVMASPRRTHDMAQVGKIHPQLRSGDLLVGDRGFCSFAHLALLQKHGVQACIRVHQRQIVDFRPHRSHALGTKTKGRPTSRWLRRLGHLDQVVEWVKPQGQPQWMTAEDYASLPASIQVRELRYQTRTPGFRTRKVTLATTLLDAQKYSAEALAELYRMRWQVETNLRHLKTTMGMDILHCKSVDGVLKEMYMFALVYNLVRMVMLEAARRQEVQPDRISFADALHWLAHAPPDQPLPALVVNPRRPNRIEPRAVKRRPKPHDLLNKPRAEMRQALLKHRPAA